MENRTFTPGQVHDLTGVSPEKLRIWRQRGHVEHEKEGGWARFQFSEVASIACMAEMIAGGISVGDAAGIMSGKSVRMDILRHWSATKVENVPDFLIVIGHKANEDGTSLLDYFVTYPDGATRILTEETNWSFFSVLNVSTVLRNLERKISELK